MLRPISSDKSYLQRHKWALKSKKKLKKKKKTATVSSVIKLKEITFKIYELLKSKNTLIVCHFSIVYFHSVFCTGCRDRESKHLYNTLCNDQWILKLICFGFGFALFSDRSKKREKENSVYYVKWNRYLCAFDIYWIWQHQIYRIRGMMEKFLRAH